MKNKFLKDVSTIIEFHLKDSSFNPETLSQKLGISRMQLHRKLKAITNRPTTYYIRQVKMEKAKRLLLSTHLNISEIAYEVGYSYPSYFTKAFIEEFGMAPSKFREAQLFNS